MWALKPELIPRFRIRKIDHVFIRIRMAVLCFPNIGQRRFMRLRGFLSWILQGCVNGAMRSEEPDGLAQLFSRCHGIEKQS